MILRKIENRFNQLFRFPREDRAILYEIMETQLDAGLTLKTVFETLHTEIKLSAETSAVAAAGYYAIEQGRPGTEGFTDSNLVPQEDALLLQSAEKNDVLVEVLHQLSKRASVNITFFGGVLAPNSYYLLIASVLLFMAIKVERFADSFSGFIQVKNNPAFEMSLTINNYLPFVVCISITALCAIWFVSTHCYNFKVRRCCLYFATDMQLQFGVKFSELSSALYSTGASHSDILSAALEIFAGSGFMSGALSDLRHRHLHEGESYNSALGETVLLPEIASTLSAMTPGDERGRFEKAHNSAKSIQESMLKKRHTKAKLLMQFGLLGAISYMLLTMLIGLYSLYDV